MKISVIHASRQRPKQAFETLRKWLNRSHNIGLEYIMSLDSTDPTLNEYRWLDGQVCINDNKTAIEAINIGAKAATGNILISVSDDTDCPDNWLVLLKAYLNGKSDFCAKVDDGLQPTLVTMPIMDRIYYERYGYVYHPGYSHMFCDQELTAVAIMTGKYLKLPLSFPHLHYSAGKSEFDAVYAKNNATWAQGESLFNERLKTNFGIADPVVPYSSIKWR